MIWTRRNCVPHDNNNIMIIVILRYPADLRLPFPASSRDLRFRRVLLHSKDILPSSTTLRQYYITYTYYDRGA